MRLCAPCLVVGAWRSTLLRSNVEFVEDEFGAGWTTLDEPRQGDLEEALLCLKAGGIVLLNHDTAPALEAVTSVAGVEVCRVHTEKALRGAWGDNAVLIL